jgi:crossover junction endodeoxyribonuclease RuvC
VSARVRILGVDPGTIRLGYAVIEAVRGRGRVELHYLECGVIAAPARESVAARLFTIASELGGVIDEFAPQQCAIERAFHGKSAASALALGQARGAMMLLAAQRGLSCHEYAPASIKRVVAGHGAATKQAIAVRVRQIFALQQPPASDAADALAIACCHALATDAAGR